MLKKKNVRRKVPDAIAKKGTQNFVIEVELNLKNKRYYEKVLLDLCTRYSQETILYIMKDETEMKWLMNLAEGWERIYFTPLEALGRISYALKFTNSSGKELYLDRLHKGSVLFYDPEDPNRDFNLDEDEEPEGEEDDWFDRWLQEGEEECRRFAEEDRRLNERRTDEREKL